MRENSRIVGERKIYKRKKEANKGEPKKGGQQRTGMGVGVKKEIPNKLTNEVKKAS